MDTNTIIAAVMQQLVTSVADEVIRRLKAENTANAILEPEILQYAMLALFRDNSEAREIVRDITSDMLENFDVCQLSDFQDLQREVESLQREVESLQEKVEELDPAVIDADDSDFSDAVCQVIRNNI